MYTNGYMGASTSGGAERPAGGATAYIGNDPVGVYNDLSKPLFGALIEGALTSKQVLAYSRWLRDQFNLPIFM